MVRPNLAIPRRLCFLKQAVRRVGRARVSVDWVDQSLVPLDVVPDNGEQVIQVPVRPADRVLLFVKRMEATSLLEFHELPALVLGRLAEVVLHLLAQ